MGPFESAKRWEYENGFYLTSAPSRLAKALAQYEIYKKVTGLPGVIMEVGVYKGASFVRFLTYREILESPYSRKIIGFDAFGAFPLPQVSEDGGLTNDVEFICNFESDGGYGLARDDLSEYLDNKPFTNYSLIQGNIFDTLPQYLEQHPELRIALLHIDVDVYDATKFTLKTLYDRIVHGGVIMFDDYATVSGATAAIEDFFKTQRDIPPLKKLAISHIPSYIAKE